jgi:hypothetical protein
VLLEDTFNSYLEQQSTRQHTFSSEHDTKQIPPGTHLRLISVTQETHHINPRQNNFNRQTKTLLIRNNIHQKPLLHQHNNPTTPSQWYAPLLQCPPKPPSITLQPPSTPTRTLKRTNPIPNILLPQTGPNPPTTPRKRGLRQIRSRQARQAADRSRAHHGKEEGQQIGCAEEPC